MPDIPRHLEHLPTYRGMPVPYVQFVGGEGPDFKVIDHEKVRRVLRERLCGVCGRKLKDVIAFIGGEKSIAQGMFTDPPMHSECARYAAQACPYLNGEKRCYSKASPKSSITIEATLIDREGIPKRMGIYYTRSYEYGTIPGQGPMLYVKAGPHLSIDMGAMPETQEADSPKFDEDQFDAIMSQIKNNEGVVLMDEVEDGYLAVKITADDLRKLDSVQRFNVVCPIDRGLFQVYSPYLEQNYFPPLQPINKELHLIFFKWQDILWGITSVLIERKSWCFEAAEKCKMRLADGTPKIFASGVHDPMPTSRLVPDMDLAFEMAGQLEGSAFPLESHRTYSLEPLHEGATGPVISVMVGK